MVFVGPSGCGKTTALRMVAGLEEISEGEIRIGDEVVNALPPRDRDVAMVFQNYALYPHKSVYENLAFPLRLRKLAKSEIDESVKRIARLLELEEQLPAPAAAALRRPASAGRDGPRDRSASRGRSSWTSRSRTSTRSCGRRCGPRSALLHKELGVTTIYVTHDQVEAMTLGQRVAVMRKGELQQVAAPQELYDRPANLFVAGFIGSPAMNFFEGAVVRRDGGLGVTFGDRQQLEDRRSRRGRAGARADSSTGRAHRRRPAGASRGRRARAPTRRTSRRLNGLVQAPRAARLGDRRPLPGRRDARRLPSVARARRRRRRGDAPRRARPPAPDAAHGVRRPVSASDTTAREDEACRDRRRSGRAPVLRPGDGRPDRRLTS